VGEGTALYDGQAKAVGTTAKENPKIRTPLVMKLVEASVK